MSKAKNMQGLIDECDRIVHDTKAADLTYFADSCAGWDMRDQVISLATVARELAGVLRELAARAAPAKR